MDRVEIEARICAAAKVWATWPNPMSTLQYRTSMPDIVRSKEDWLAYNNEASRDNLRITFTPDTKQHQDAMEVINWLSFCTRRYKQHAKPTVRAIVMLYCMKMDNVSYGFGSLSKELEKYNVRMSKDTVRRRYNQAMMDLEYGLSRKGLIDRYLNSKE